MKESTKEDLKLKNWEEIADMFKGILNFDQLDRLKKWHDKNKIKTDTKLEEWFNLPEDKPKYTIDDLREQCIKAGIPIGKTTAKDRAREPYDWDAVIKLYGSVDKLPEHYKEDYEKYLKQAKTNGA